MLATKLASFFFFLMEKWDLSSALIISDAVFVYPSVLEWKGFPFRNIYLALCIWTLKIFVHKLHMVCIWLWTNESHTTWFWTEPFWTEIWSQKSHQFSISSSSSRISVKALGDLLLFILVEILQGLITSFLWSLTRLSRCIMMMLYCYFVLCEEIA